MCTTMFNGSFSFINHANHAPGVQNNANHAPGGGGGGGDVHEYLFHVTPIVRLRLI